MKIRARVLLPLFVLSMVLAGVALAQEPQSPGEQHKHMARMVGDWEFTNKFSMGPGQPPAESKGTMHAESLMGGRYIEHYWKGDMMGRPFEGRGTNGYDTMTKQFVSSWIDNQGTGIMLQTGSCDESGKTCTLVGDTMDPSGKKMAMKSVITWIDNDTFKNEMYGPDPSGKETKWMEITAKRKK